MELKESYNKKILSMIKSDSVILKSLPLVLLFLFIWLLATQPSYLSNSNTFYNFKIIIFLSLIYLAYKEYQSKNMTWVRVYILLIVVINPIAEFKFSDSAWFSDNIWRMITFLIGTILLIKLYGFRYTKELIQKIYTRLAFSYRKTDEIVKVLFWLVLLLFLLILYAIIGAFIGYSPKPSIPEEILPLLLASFTLFILAFKFFNNFWGRRKILRFLEVSLVLVTLVTGISILLEITTYEPNKFNLPTDLKFYDSNGAKEHTEPSEANGLTAQQPKIEIEDIYNAGDTFPQPAIGDYEEYLEWRKNISDLEYVTFLREALDNYLDGGNDGVSHLAIVGLETEITGLKNFDNSYYRSKFVTFPLSGSLAGGVEVRIIFIDKADKVFTAWIYPLATKDLELRGFWQNEKFDSDAVEEIVNNPSFAELDAF